MTTHRDILTLLGTQEALADSLGGFGFKLTQPAISMWRARDDIPALYWPALVKIAHGKLLPDGSAVTIELLAGSQKKLREASA